MSERLSDEEVAEIERIASEMHERSVDTLIYRTRTIACLACEVQERRAAERNEKRIWWNVADPEVGHESEYEVMESFGCEIGEVMQLASAAERPHQWAALLDNADGDVVVELFGTEAEALAAVRAAKGGDDE